MNEQLLNQQIELLRASRSEYEIQSGNWCPQDTNKALMVHDFQDFILAGIQHWNSICRIRDSFLAHEAECDKNHDEQYSFIEECIRDFQTKANAVEASLSRIESDYEVDHAAEFRNALREVNLLTMNLNELTKTTPLNAREF